MQAEQLNCPTGQFSLVRPGTPEKMPLRAWDSADELLIDVIDQEFPQRAINIVNDGFGALAVALANNAKDSANCWISDSFCARQALRQNQQLNHLPLDDNLYNCDEEWATHSDIWAVKIPKNSSLLSFQLQKIATIANKQQQPQILLLSGMVKHLPKTLMELLSKYGTPQRDPLRKKAMLIRLTISPEQIIPPSKYPKQHRFFNTRITAQANVFGRDKLDQGAELLLNNMPTASGEHRVADLCCGTGILGLNYAITHPLAEISFFDESHMAVNCAEAGLALNELNNAAHFCWDDSMKSADSNHFDLILCNPPFHEQHAVGDHIAWRLFKDAQRCLKSGGRLRIVGNRHLGYHNKLKRIFGNATNIASNAKFVVLESVKQS